MGVTRAGAVGVVVAGFAHGAAAEPARVDWARGLVIAEGLGVADRQAPSPAVALGTSKRGGAARARAALEAAVEALPMASGATVGDRMKDAAVAARVGRAVEHAVELAADPETDGSWHVTLAVPVESVRQAVAGVRVLSSDGGRGDVGLAVVVVDGAGAATPAVGWVVGGTPAAAVWTTAAPAWAQAAPHVRAKAVARGRIDVALPTGAGASTLFLLMK